MPGALRVVANPHRWRLLGELARSDRRVSELTGLLGEPQNLISYHLRELRGAGLVSSRRSSFDGRDAYYRVDLSRCAEVLCAAAASLDPGLRLEVVAPAAVQRRGRRPRVLFLCTGNSARSQIAEAVLEHLSGHAIEACSAGSHPKPLHANAVRVMARRGIDISANTSKHLDEFVASRFDQVITLCDKVREVCPEFPGPPEAVHWSIPDPGAAGDSEEESYSAFERVAADLEVRIRFLIVRLSIPEGGTIHVR
jgi:ArsR family transcriptional regulator, arsenate/arsenite/antimonite-responsive transcriptional repressor / arsenate reductase (thioredoxin)